jgi:hypothetical protein
MIATTTHPEPLLRPTNARGGSVVLGLHEPLDVSDALQETLVGLGRPIAAQPLSDS